jgi:hypothetical protein
MEIVNFTPLPALAGGAIIGLAATILLLSHGKVAGISGLYGGLFVPGTTDRPFRSAFVGGLLGGALILLFAVPRAFATTSPVALPLVAVAGLLVGFGTRLGNGCTSGHGVCGISRLSYRSVAATATFMATGFATVFVTHHVLGGS